MSLAAPLLELRNVSVSFDGYTILDGIDLEIREGEIHAIVGEHGAGKTTLVRLLAGVIHGFAGQLVMRGTAYESFNTDLSRKHGIGIVHQEGGLIPTFTAVENIFAGHFLVSPLRTLSSRRMAAAVSRILDRFHIELDLKTPVKDLSASDRHLVELIKAIYAEPALLVFDEISSKFNQTEIDLSFRVMQRLRHEGCGIIYISNSMKEIFEFADRVSVFKSGKVVSTEYITDIDKVRLVDITYSFATTREELRQSNIELYNYKKYNEDIIKNIPIGVIIIDEAHTIYLLNYAAECILHLEAGVKTDSIEDVLARLPAELAEDILASIETRVIRVWNEIKYVEDTVIKITTFPFKDENYRFLGTIILLEDVSRECFFKNYLVRTERLSSVAELAAGVAHEVNNPLGIIINYIEILKMKSRDEFAQERLTKIDSELNRIKSIIESLLSFSHPNDIPFTPVDVDGLIDETLLLMKHQIDLHQVEVRRKSHGRGSLVAGNPNQLKQVFINLITNSLEALEPGGILEIATKPNRQKQAVDIRFVDNGKGVPAELREKIFNPFFSTKESGRNTGLGLSICQYIIESHHGMLSLNKGAGTDFSVLLPLSPSSRTSSRSQHPLPRG